MPKLKTKKAVAKKVRVTAGKKLIRRHTKQSHLNAKQTGKFRRKKRSDLRLFKTEEKNMMRGIPYSN